MSTIFILIFVAIVAMIIFWTGFRNWIGQQLSDLWDLITIYTPVLAAWFGRVFRWISRALGIYALVVLILSGTAFGLIIISLLINYPAFTAFAFVWALSLILLAWLPAGIVLRIFGVTDKVISKEIRTFVAWVAFVGFLALVLPDIVSFKTIMGAALIALIVMGLTAKFNALDKIVFPLVAVMVLTLAWKHFFPEDFRSTTRYAQSWSKRVNTGKDRGSIGNETEAATSYAVVLKDIKSLYSEPGDEMDKIVKELDEGTIVRLVNHKQEVLIYDGQGFVEIQLPKKDGSFVHGSKYWIEAEFVEVVSPRDIISKRQNKQIQLQPQPQQPQGPAPISMAQKDSVFRTGEYEIELVNGVTPFNIITWFDSGNGSYTIESQNFEVYVQFANETPIKATPGVNFGHRVGPKFRLFGDDRKVKLVVT